MDATALRRRRLSRYGWVSSCAATSAGIVQWQHSRMKKKVLDQLRHVDATPKVLNDLETTVVGAVRHIYEVAARAVQEIERLEAENRALKKLCNQHGIDLPRTKR